MAGRISTKPFADGTRFGEYVPRDWRSIGAAIAIASEETNLATGTRVKGARGARKRAASVARDRAVATLRNTSLTPLRAFADGIVKDTWQIKISLATESAGPPYRMVRAFLAFDPDPVAAPRLWAVELDGVLHWSDLGDIHRAGIKVAPFLKVLRPFVKPLPRSASRFDALSPMPRQCNPTADDLRHAFDGCGLGLEREVSETADGDAKLYESRIKRMIADWRKRNDGTSDPAPMLAIIQHPISYLNGDRAKLYERAYSSARRALRLSQPHT